MDRETLEKRIAEATQAKDQFVANANHMQGIIDDCNYWLTQLDQPTEVPKEEAKKK